MERYTGPTLITYEEWWAWERKRLQAGKMPSYRRIERWCTICKHDVKKKKKKYCPHTDESVCDKVTITCPRKETYANGEGSLY